MVNLSSPSGQYPVGATTFVLPVRPTSTIGDSQRQVHVDGQSQLEPTLTLEEVAFTVYYPAVVDNNSKKGLDWLVRPVDKTLKGYEHFLGVKGFISASLYPLLYLYGRTIKVPIYPNAPLLNPNNAELRTSLNQGEPETNGAKPWPLVIFSHGLGGSRTTYSNLCTRVASSGRVVIAFEHRDGTSPAVMPKNPDTGKVKAKLYTQPEDVTWPNGKPSNPFALRLDQLEFRRKEIYLGYNAFKKFIQTGDRGELFVLDKDGKEMGGDDHETPAKKKGGECCWYGGKGVFDWNEWRNGCGGTEVRCEEDVTLTGHSFGGATVLSLLSSPAPDGYARIPISKAVVHDPWLEPLPSPGPTPYSPRLSSSTNRSSETINDAVIPMLILNSEGFTLWTDHFARLQAIAKGWGDAPIITLIRAEHTSFSDFPLLAPNSKSAKLLLDISGTLTMKFFEGHLDVDTGKGMEGIPRRKMEVEHVEPGKGNERGEGEKKQKRLVGDVGEVIVH
ncbi:hypothetical protein JAAARDRAFT_38519 [Jaapia argillacea MUCL 33604]|uniref:1-alkyl-2-acetylglycerophosphocholine esterase n=1 Tax=Jaapia argillacea MUCL 33604 TaxID=933084 RepID=A0A067PKG9_9AGAM|nr:hypothetical protein JAAARDRAFT_38519 [Jaapia argillacea MUCL 33604]